MSSVTTRWLSFAELDARSREFDALVARTADVDAYCSSSDWILPAQAAFSPEAKPLVLATDSGYAALMSVPIASGGRVAVPLEASWGLASPFIGEDPDALVGELLAALDDPAMRDAAPVIAISGVATGGRALRAVVRRGRARGIVRPGPVAQRIVADLGGGMDGFWSRRSAKFRATARRARRSAAARGVSYERIVALPDADAIARTWQRVLAVERRCWKAQEASGIDEGPMHTFYEHMLPRLAARGTLRLVFVSRDGVDLAYCFGAVFGSTYRGLQVSFDHAHAAESPGVLAHLEMIELLCDEGVTGYDLGSDMDYKRRWGELGLETGMVIVIRTPR